MTTSKVHTQEIILKAARDQFLARGYANTTLDNIATAAGFSRQIIYDYYGNKLTLLHHVLDDISKTFIVSLQEIKKTIKPELRLLSMARLIFDNLRSLGQYNISEAGEDIASRPSAMKSTAAFLSNASVAIEEGVASGTIIPEAQAETFLISAISATSGFLANGHLIEYLLKKDLTSSASMEAWGDHIARMVVAPLLTESGRDIVLLESIPRGN